jgi:hypothetical protein
LLQNDRLPVTRHEKRVIGFWHVEHFISICEDILHLNKEVRADGSPRTALAELAPAGPIFRGSDITQSL